MQIAQTTYHLPIIGIHIASKLFIHGNVSLLTDRLHLFGVNVGQVHQMSGSPRLSSVLRACYRPYSLRSGVPHVLAQDDP